LLAAESGNLYFSGVLIRTFGGFFVNVNLSFAFAGRVPASCWVRLVLFLGGLL